MERGSTPIFVVAMVIVENGEAARAIDRVIRSAMTAFGVTHEFKFNKSRTDVRDGFFNTVRDCPFKVRAIVVKKNIIHSSRLRTRKEEFYRFFVRQMLAHDDGILDNAKIVIDGSGDRAFRRTFRTSLRRQLGPKLKDVRFARSNTETLVQLADMCAGAIARSYRTDRKHAARWRQMLGPRIDKVWEFS